MDKYTYAYYFIFSFYYSQRQSLSKSYFDKLKGIYAGQYICRYHNEYKRQRYQRFFKGNFDYSETENSVNGHQIEFHRLTDGVYTFYGKIRFELYINKKKHPYKINENRTYVGTLYVVNRIDFNIEDLKLMTILVAEYEIRHYREMATLKFTLKV